MDRQIAFPKTVLTLFALALLLAASSCVRTKTSIMTDPEGLCAKQSMQADGIVRLSKIEVYPDYVKEYMEYAVEVGEKSLRAESGVLAMYAMADKTNPCKITILEIYAGQEAYKQHIASAHFRKYKIGTLHMVKSLELCDQTALNPNITLVNSCWNKSE